MSIAKRIEEARKHAGLTQKGLADKVGISQTAVHKLEAGRSKSSRRTVSIALTCGVDPIWLETGRGEMTTFTPTGGGQQTKSSLLTKSPILTTNGIINMVSNGFDSLGEDDIKGWLPLDIPGENAAFGMSIIDDSMAPEFNESEVALFAPATTAVHGDFTLCLMNGDNSPIFAQLIVMGNKQYLKPINTRYNLIEISGGLEVLGIAHSKYRSFK